MCITCPISQSCGSLAFRLFENQTHFFTLNNSLSFHLHLFTDMLWDILLLHAFLWSISCHHWTMPLMFFDLKNWPWKHTAWWNTPAGNSLGNIIRDLNPYDTKKVFLSSGSCVSVWVFICLFWFFGVFSLFFFWWIQVSILCQPILCVKVMQSNFSYKNRLSRSKRVFLYLTVEEIMRLWPLCKPVYWHLSSSHS